MSGRYKHPVGESKRKKVTEKTIFFAEIFCHVKNLLYFCTAFSAKPKSAANFAKRNASLAQLARARDL